MRDALDRGIAHVARRLAALLADVAQGDGALEDARAFLLAAAGEPDEGGLAASDETGADRMGAWATGGPDSEPILRVAAGFSLTPLELDLVVLAGLPDEHEGFAGVLRAVHPRGDPHPTAGLAARLFCDTPQARSGLRGLLECGAAVRAGALRLEPDRPFFERSLLLPERLWSGLRGIDVWPAAVQRIDGPAPSAGLARWLGSRDCRVARRALERGERCTVLVTADTLDAATERADALASSAGVPAVRVTPGAGAALPDFERLVTLHATAHGVVPIVRLPHTEEGGAQPAFSFSDHPAALIVCAREGGAHPHGARPVLPVRADRLLPADREAAWAALLPELHDHAADLGMRYGVEPASAAATAADVRALAATEGRAPTLDDVARSVSTRTAVAASAGIELIHPRAGWDSLVLSHDRMLQLREALDRLLHQGRVIDEWRFLNGRPGARGVRMLFSGPPGTGKTLSAEVLAKALGVDLMLVDISRVVSKWIGETEKNLGAVFDAAEQAQAVLLFDEADALFGKRTEVSDAHDRYANLETAYLLNRLERFDGLAILSTNLRQNIDPAFVRRLEFVVEFDEPNLADRWRLWRCHLPPTAPLAPDADLHELATLYPVVGGLIRNAAVAAGFLAAAEGGSITRGQLIRAVRREYDKAGRAFPGAPWGHIDS